MLTWITTQHVGRMSTIAIRKMMRKKKKENGNRIGIEWQWEDDGLIRVHVIFFCWCCAPLKHCKQVFVGQKKTSALERELGRIFRSSHFNMAQRRQGIKRDPTQYSVRELYALKNEGDPVFNSRILSSIYSKHKTN